MEIDDSAVAVQKHPFSGNTAFMLGNEVRRAGLGGAFGWGRDSPGADVPWPLQGPRPRPHVLDGKLLMQHDVCDSTRSVFAPRAACSTASAAARARAQGQGLSQRQMRLCDGFVYIPQHGAGTASLNVTVAASIVLHHFAAWAGLPERRREGAKFDVGERPARTHGRGGRGGGGREGEEDGKAAARGLSALACVMCDA